MTAHGPYRAAVNGALDILMLRATGPTELPAAGQLAAQFPELLTRDRGDVAVIRLAGELDAASAPALRAHLRGIGSQGRARCVADLTSLAFIDSACLGVLVRHCQQVRARGGSFALAGPHGAVRTVLAATGLVNWFEVRDTLSEALARENSGQPAEAPLGAGPGDPVTAAPTRRAR